MTFSSNMIGLNSAYRDYATPIFLKIRLGPGNRALIFFRELAKKFVHSNNFKN